MHVFIYTGGEGNRTLIVMSEGSEIPQVSADANIACHNLGPRFDVVLEINLRDLI